MTGLDAVAASLRLVGAIAQGEDLDADEAVDGLASINRMLGGWSNDSLMVAARVREEFSLTNGQSQYTMGVGGNFNTSRPMRIDQALIEIQSSSPVTEVPIRILTLEEWADIRAKGVSSDVPECVYLDPSAPLALVNLFPVPTSANKLVLWSWKPLTSIATLATVLDLAPGMEEAIVYNGAVRLAPEYGRPVPAEVMQIAIESKAAIQRMNYRPQLLRVDSALLPSGGGYNILTGGQ